MFKLTFAICCAKFGSFSKQPLIDNINLDVVFLKKLMNHNVVRVCELGDVEIMQIVNLIVKKMIHWC